MSPPLVSCILPTHNRARYIRAAIDCFLSQTYAPLELVIVDSGNDGTISLVPHDIPNITYRWLRRPVAPTTGEMRNLCCETATGEIICHFDSDDWSAPNRVHDQVTRMLDADAVLTGYKSLLFYEEDKREVYRWAWQNGLPFCLGTSLCYRKDLWQSLRFGLLRIGEDFRFFQQAHRQHPHRVAIAHGGSQMVARIHKTQTCYKNLTSTNYQRVGLSELPEAFRGLQPD